MPIANNSKIERGLLKMKTIQVCYDLKNASEDQYLKIKGAIKFLGKAEHIQYSVWIVSTNMSVEQVRDRLRIHLKPNDSLFVSEITSFASQNAPVNATNLIRRTWSQPKLVINTRLPILPSRNQPINPLRKTF